MSKPTAVLVPSIDRRLTAWLDIAHRQKTGAELPKRPAVTISRQFGCEGYPLAERLKALFDERTGETWNIYDKALLEKVAQDKNLSMEVLSHLGDASKRLDTISFLFPGFTSHGEAFRHLPAYILEIAGRGNAIIVGRGGAVITNKLANCFHFRLEADFEFRVGSIMRRMELDRKAAEKTVRENQKTREKFLSECLHVKLEDKSWYDCVFNNARHGVEEIAHSIVAYVETAWPRTQTT